MNNPYSTPILVESKVESVIKQGKGQRWPSPLKCLPEEVQGIESVSGDRVVLRLKAAVLLEQGLVERVEVDASDWGRT